MLPLDATGMYKYDNRVPSSIRIYNFSPIIHVSARTVFVYVFLWRLPNPFRLGRFAVMRIGKIKL